MNALEDAAQVLTEHLAVLSRYWAGPHIPDESPAWRVGGVIFSALAAMDGSAAPPPVVLAPAGQVLPREFLPGRWVDRWSGADPLEGRNPAVTAFLAHTAERADVTPDLPAVHAATSHLFVELRALEVFFTQRAEWTLLERTCGVTFALLALLDGDVRGASGWALYPEDAGTFPAVHLGNIELHGTWSAATRRGP